MRSGYVVAIAVSIRSHAMLAGAIGAIAALRTPAVDTTLVLPGTEVELPSDGHVTQGTQEPPEIDGPALTRKHYVEGVEIAATLSLAREDLALDLQWTCGRRWTDVRMIGRRDSRVALERLGAHVTQTIRCR